VYQNSNSIKSQNQRKIDIEIGLNTCLLGGQRNRSASRNEENVETGESFKQCLALSPQNRCFEVRGASSIESNASVTKSIVDFYRQNYYDGEDIMGSLCN
jgi:phosphotransferase system IIA component